MSRASVIDLICVRQSQNNAARACRQTIQVGAIDPWPQGHADEFNRLGHQRRRKLGPFGGRDRVVNAHAIAQEDDRMPAFGAAIEGRSRPG